MSKVVTDALKKISDQRWAAVAAENEAAANARFNAVDNLMANFLLRLNDARSVLWNPKWGHQRAVPKLNFLSSIFTAPDWRLTIPHGDRVKTVSPDSRQVLLIGTHFGPVAIHQTNIPARRCTITSKVRMPMAVTTTIAFAEAWNNLFETKFLIDEDRARGFLHDFYWFLEDDFLDLVEDMKENELAHGREVGDGYAKIEHIARARVASIQARVVQSKQERQSRKAEAAPA